MARMGHIPCEDHAFMLYRTEKTGEEIVSDAITPGTLRVERKQLFVACKDQWLRITDLQLAGKKRMDAQAFLNGMQDVENCVL